MRALNPNPVRRVLRNDETGLYFVGNGQWTKDPGKARDFDNVWDILREARKQNLHHSCAVIHRVDTCEDDVELVV